MTQTSLDFAAAAPAASVGRLVATAPMGSPVHVTFQVRGGTVVEAWFGPEHRGAAAGGEPGTGYVRGFDAHQWPAAAEYIEEVRAGTLVREARRRLAASARKH